MPPSKERVNFWRSRTGISFDPFESMNLVTEKVILCPKCDSAVRVDLMNQLGTGYLQQKFTAKCAKPTCDFGEITKEKLTLRKLCQNISLKDNTEPASHLAGTFFSDSLLDVSKGKAIKKRMVQSFRSKVPLSKEVETSVEYQHFICLAVMKRADYSLSTLRAQMGFGTQSGLLGRIMNAYNDDKIYSVELVGAVIRQESFVRKMYDLDWTRPGYFDSQGDEMALQHALARYHAFLDLMASSPAYFFVPTLDIDLIWHTHQLLPTRYNSDCREYLKRFIDHDDKVEGLRLSSAFDITCRVWKERFGVQYTYCGCPIPGDNIGQRLSRVVGIYSPPLAPPSHLVPFERADLISATHPSDHNAVRFVVETERAHKLITQKYENLAKKKQKEKEKETKKAATKVNNEKAKTGGYISAGASSTAKSKHDEAHRGAYYDTQNGSSTSRSSVHNMAFLVPVPIFFDAGLLVAGGRVSALACVADGGTFVSPVGGCSNCGSAGECGGGTALGAGGCGGGASCGGGHISLSSV